RLGRRLGLGVTHGFRVTGHRGGFCRSMPIRPAKFHHRSGARPPPGPLNRTPVWPKHASFAASYSKARAMTDNPPDRLCNDPRSPYHDVAMHASDVCVGFSAVEKNNVEEYCVSEGWIRVAAGKTLDRHGNPLTI